MNLVEQIYIRTAEYIKGMPKAIRKRYRQFFTS